MQPSHITHQKIVSQHQLLYLNHFPTQQAVLYNGRCQPLISAAIAKLTIAVVSPAVQLPRLCVCKDMGARAMQASLIEKYSKFCQKYESYFYV